MERKTFVLIAVFALAFLLIPYVVTPVYASEPSLIDVLDYLGFANVDESDVETFPPGEYDVTLYAEFAKYSDDNELSFYQVCSSTCEYYVIFTGPEGGSEYIDPPVTKTFTVPFPFGLSMLVASEGHRYFTETSKNPDGYQHAKVYCNKDDPGMFLIGLENLYGEEADRDFQDMVISLKLQTPFVIPEVPFGTILGLVSMFIMFAGFTGFRRFRHQ